MLVFMEYVSMYVRPKLTFVSFYFCFFPQQCAFFEFFNGRLEKKNRKMFVFMEYVCM